MSIYTLAGLVSPTVDNQSFLIPYFCSTASNQIFAQNLDSDFRIQEFLLFNPENYIKVDFLIPHSLKAIGSEGVLAFTLGESKIFIGNYGDIRTYLEDVLPSFLTPLFAMEAYSYLGDREKYNASSRSAANLFSDAETPYRTDWHSINLNSQEILAKQSSRGETKKIYNSLFAEYFEILVAEFNKSKWHKLWKNAWSKFEGNSDLLEIALSWLKSDNGENSSQAQVIIVLLKRQQRDVLIEKESSRWLIKAGIREKTWPTVWLLLNSKKIYNSTNFDLAASYLDLSLEQMEGINQNTVYQWSKIYTTIKEHKRHTSFMNSVAIKASEKFGHNDVFMSVVVLAIIMKSDPPSWAIKYARSYVNKNPKPTNLWGDTFSEIYRIRPDSDLQVLGTKWLKSEGIKTNTWRKVWVCLSHKMTKEDSIGIAKNFLRTGDSSITIWPYVLIEVLKSNHSTLADKELGYRWLLNDKRPSFSGIRRDIEQILLQESQGFFRN